LGLYYNGRFNTGIQSEGQAVTTHPDNNGASVIQGVDLNGQDGDGNDIFDWLTGRFQDGSGLNGVIDHHNYFGVLLGFGDYGIKFTLEDSMETADIRHVYVSADSDLFNTGTNYIPEGSSGYYRYRGGVVIPKLQWGSARDMKIGEFTFRPSASLAFTVGFDEAELGLNDPDGESLLIEDFSKNYLIPALGFDTGYIKIREGGWGSLSLGFSDEFSFRVDGEGSGEKVPWKNRLAPYAGFSYIASGNFALGARLEAPVHFGWDGSTGTYFGVGAYYEPSSVLEDFPTFKAGFQLKGGFFDKLAERHGVLDKILLNWGIKVNLPAYIVYGSYEYKDNENSEDVVITENGTKQWITGALLQEINGGITFFITERAFFDASLKVNPSSPGDFSVTVLLSVKH
jgi:hypothetical protein